MSVFSVPLFSIGHKSLRRSLGIILSKLLSYYGSIFVCGDGDIEDIQCQAL